MFWWFSFYLDWTVREETWKYWRG